MYAFRSTGRYLMEDLFQMLDGAADGAFVINENQQLVYWNQAAQEILGHSPPDVIQKNCYEILRGQSDDGHPKLPQTASRCPRAAWAGCL